MHPHARKPASEYENAGGAYIRRRIMIDGVWRNAGEILSAERVAKIPRANLVALINTGRLELWPKAPETPPANTSYFLVRSGPGLWHIIEGVQITDEPLSRADAEALISSGDKPAQNASEAA